MTKKQLMLKILQKIAPNINVTIKDKNAEEEHEIVAPSEQELEEMNMKCRDLYMEKVYSKINKHKILAMQQMTKGRYEDRSLGQAEFLMDVPELHKNGYFKNLGRLQLWYLRTEHLFTKRNIMIGLVLFVIFGYTCLPFLKYSWLTIDRHYFGITTDPLPPLVKGSIQRIYHEQNNMPHTTIDDINYEHALANERRRKGLPMLWEDQKKKDMELYPLIEPIVNYFYDKGLATHKVASDISRFAKKEARRLL